MSEYPVNRGIGKPVEFKGLKSQYLFIFCGGLLAVFVVFIVLFMAGVNQWLCIGFIVSASLLLVWQTFRLNAKYGTHGLMKAAARKRHPRLNRNPKFIILIISNAITEILCIDTVKFPLFLFFKRQNSVRSTILFRFTEKMKHR